MSDIATKLAELKQIRNGIRAAIESKGVDLPIGSPMADYPSAIESIQTGGTWTKMPITILDSTNVAPVLGATPRIDSDLEGLAIITSEIDNFKYLFRHSKIQSVVNLATGVTDMGYMFVGSKAIELDLSNFDTSNVTDMRSMFVGSQTTELDLSNFDTSNVTDMRSMFNGSKAIELDLSNFDTSNVTDMGYMFEGSQTTELDLSNFDTSNVTDMRSMFKGSQIKTVYVRSQADKDRFETMATNTPPDLEFVVK